MRPLCRRLLGVATLLMLPACFQPESVFCPQRGDAPAFVCPAGSRCAATQDICIYDSCGDGVVEPGEVCDDGNKISGDGCKADCRSDESCGNGPPVDVAAGEVCDDGNNTSGDGCSANCRSTELCGNGIIDLAIGEVCDDGNTRSGDGCSADCLSAEHCGNDYIDSVKGEVCDDGNIASGDGCSSDCRSLEICGNGITDSAPPRSEVCDDGNNVSGDGCSADCRSNETCGNSIVDTAAGEVCDDGNTVSGDSCSSDCHSGEGCGNGIVDSARGEECDDGNTSSNDNCTSQCKLNVCGDGYVDGVLPRVEECDEGGETATCDSNCTFAACGDGQVNATAGETCDTSAGPGCDNDPLTPNPDCDTAACDGRLASSGNVCTVAFCGDGYRNAMRGEECDTAGETVTCNANCTSTRCGDGVVNSSAGEQCDQNNGNDTPVCDGNSAPAGERCTTAVCGDGYANAARNEQCDDYIETANCDSNCTLVVCGDGTVNGTAGEQCDNPGGSDTSTCDGKNATAGQQCTGVLCGDGYQNLAASEGCDDGNSDNADDCTNVCHPGVCGDSILKLRGSNVEECDTGVESAACDGDCTSVVCGDGRTNTAAGEQCDVTADTAACDGPGAGAQKCTQARCGDGYPNAARGEDCDDSGESAACDSNCTFAVCGDGTVNGTAGEACDNLGGTDSVACDGAGAGAQKCTGVFCGDGYANAAAGEQCDDANADTGDDCLPGCRLNVCGDGFVDLQAPVVEQCDPGSANSATCDGPGAGMNACTPAECGDAYRNAAAGEACDSGNVDSAACDGATAAAVASGNACTAPVCGDGYANAAAGEQCDDSNTINTDDCTSSCQINTCGDGFQDLQGPITEACDDGNVVNETQCPYGPTADCTYCNSVCGGEIHLPARYCGDRTVQSAGGESCDDGNALACGTCGTSCSAAVTPANATGQIDAISYSRFQDSATDVSARDFFTVDDGIHPAITFEIDKGGAAAGVTPGRIGILLASGDGSWTAAAKIAQAINDPSLNLWITATAQAGSNVIALAHDYQTALGNQALLEGVHDSSFRVTAMTGGRGGDCGSGTGCGSNADCSPDLACDVVTHTCKAPVQAPTVSSTAPASPANDNNPVVTGTSAPGTTVRIYGNGTCTAPVLGTGTADAGGNFGIMVAVADGTTSTFYAQATDGVGSTSTCSSTFAIYVEDSTAPGSPAFTGSTPASPANNTNPTLQGTAEPGSLVRLYTDGSCAGAVAGSGVATGGAFSIAVTVGNGTTTTFNATAQDAAGNVSACSTSTLTYDEVP